jgi:aminopeptidase N
MTPKMSVYLLAFVVSDLSGIPMLGETNHTLYARADVLMETGIMGAFFSSEFLKIMESVFEFDYEIPKLDSVAVPDHGSAMENW